MKRDLDDAVRHFRLGETAAGSEALERFLAAFQGLLARLDVGTDDARALGALLRTLEAAMERHDHLRVADLLEHELAPLFED